MTDHQLPGRRRESLIDAIDRLLDVGTAISGDAIIRLADVDLIHLDLRLLLAAVIGPPAPDETAGGSDERPGAGIPQGEHGGATSLPVPPAPGGAAPGRSPAQRPPAGERPSDRPEQRLDQGLGQLVVAVVELVRQLLERQAVRRMRAGTLDPEQMERLGNALQALEQRMVDLRQALGVSTSELDQAIGTVEQLLDSPGTEPGDAAEPQRRVS